VQGLQEEYLKLEERLCQLSKIARQERKQLSDELETASTGESNGHSFQQQLLQLSDKQKVLLHCFDNQKRLGSQLKLLLSSQSHYGTRSKTLLQQSHSQENGSSGYHDNIKVSSRRVETSKVTMVTTSHSLPVEPVQPVMSSIKLPSSQLTTALAEQLNKSSLPALFNTSKANSVGIAKQQKSVDVNTAKLANEKSQQSVGVATQKQTAPIPIHESQTLQPVSIIPKLQKTVGVAKQQQQQTVGLGKQQTVGVAKQLQQTVGVSTNNRQWV